MGSNHTGVRIGRGEIDSILGPQSSLDHQEMVWRYARVYQKLGWVLVPLRAQDGSDLKGELGENPEFWSKQGRVAGLQGTKINLGVRTGRKSRLLVLEVAKGQGEAVLDRYGRWRAECIAALGDGREQHFYAWNPLPLLESVSCWVTPEWSWFGEGQIVPAPPSFDPAVQESWRWLCPPWEKRPRSPSQLLCNFLRQQVIGEPEAPAAVNLSWQEIYCLVSPHETLLKALFATTPSMEDYYHDLLRTAGRVGIKAPEVLLALLWHAPLGDARQHPARWDYLQKLVAAAQNQPEMLSVGEPDHFELILGQALSLANEDPGAGSEQPRLQPGPPCFLKRRLTRAPQPGARPRAPLSSRRTGKLPHED
jgi:hypothetical protein